MKSNFSKFIQHNQFQFFVQENDAHTQKFKTLKGCFNTFQPVDKSFGFSRSIT